MCVSQVSFFWTSFQLLNTMFKWKEVKSGILFFGRAQKTAVWFYWGWGGGDRVGNNMSWFFFVCFFKVFSSKTFQVKTGSVQKWRTHFVFDYNLTLYKNPNSFCDAFAKKQLSWLYASVDVRVCVTTNTPGQQVLWRHCLTNSGEWLASQQLLWAVRSLSSVPVIIYQSDSISQLNCVVC